jgi:hypothetical protein
MMDPHWRQLRATLEMARADAREEVENDLEFDLLACAHIDAEWAVLRAPAPDPEALIYKLEVFRDEEAYRLNDDAVHEVISGMIADLLRLAKDRD